LSSLFSVPVEEIQEYENQLEQSTWFFDEFNSKKEVLVDENSISGTTSIADCETLYLVCRIIQPETVVETGCRYGAFDAYISLAMEHNGCGQLHSLDLPGGPESFEYGYLIPNNLRDRWSLRLGDASEILVPWLNELEGIDLFLHDSEHTVRHMLYEYEAAYPYLRTDGVIATHDVLLSNIFQSFANRKNMDVEKIINTGISMK
jgi:predicted O-methyltransferase YrrM